MMSAKARIRLLIFTHWQMNAVLTLCLLTLCGKLRRRPWEGLGLTDVGSKPRQAPYVSVLEARVPDVRINSPYNVT